MTLKSGEEADTTKKRKRDFGEEVEVDFEEAEKENEADLEQEVEVDLGDAAEEENDADLEQVEEETPAGQTWEDVALRMKEDLLSVANVAEQHEVGDFLSASSENYSLGKSSSMMRTLVAFEAMAGND